MEEEIKEQAVPFLIYDQNTKIFTLTEQGEEVIKNISGNFGVIAVAGMYRTGKSYLLNRMLLNKQKGFSVGPTVNPCTKGLWIWSKPIYGTDSEGKRLPLLLIDTEGFGAFDEDQNHDVRIFTLAILLCSYFVYNSLGSIDENAIQALSFVINLSKHISLRNKNNSSKTQNSFTNNFNSNDFNNFNNLERENSSNFSKEEEMANLFPSFLWILRDFALQLVDDNGESITPKEYLEKVLDFNVKTQDQEQKNKIRKLIKTYFRDRDCFTMVRPTLKEKELQNMDNASPDNLRPEFLEQILTLRKKILNKVRPKTFNNQTLNSEMYINLIKSLIEALNSGQVPNIENTWISMCKVECYKAFEQSEEMYEKLIRELSQSQSNIKSLKEIHEEAKEKALSNYKSKAIGEVSSEFLKMLKDKIKEQYGYYFNLQLEENKNNFLRILKKWYGVIEYKIQGNELKNPEDIETEFKSLEYMMNENYSNYEGRYELFNNFKTKVLNFSSEFFVNKINNEVEIIKQEKNQIVEKLNNEIKDIKNNYETDLQKRNLSYEQLREENKELKENVNKLKENLAILEKENDLQVKNSSEKSERIKEEYDRKFNSLNNNLAMQEEKSKEIERKNITLKAEFEKEKALYEQKIEQQSKQIDEYSKREKENGVEIKSQLKEQNIAFKEMTQKYESQIKSMRLEMENLKEKVIDLDSQNQEKEHNLELEKIKNEEISNKLNSEKGDFSEKINTLKNKLENEKKNFMNNMQQKNEEISNRENLLKIKTEENELKFKSLEENLKSEINKLTKDKAVITQNNEFLEIQNKELISQMEEQKKAHENIISTLESKTFSMVGHEEFQKKVDEIKLYFENDKKSLEENHEKSKINLMGQIDSLTEKLNESEFKAKINIEELNKEMSESQIKLEKANKLLNSLREEKNSLSENLSNSNLLIQEKIKKIQEENEKKNEEKENKHQKEISELNKSSEETINQMKALFETEKIRFEERMKEEKHKNEKKTKFLNEDSEQKLKELENELREEIENLQNERDDLEHLHNDYVSGIESEMGQLNNKIEGLENSLKESKDAYSSCKNQYTSQIDQLNLNNNNERKNLLTKIENLTNDNNNKEKENVSLIVKRDQLEKMVQEKEGNYNNLKKEYEEEKKEIMEKLEEYKKINNESNDDFMIKKLEFTRVNALLTQQIEFLNKKIEDHSNTIESNQKRHEERLFSLRNDVEKDMNEKFERTKKEKEDLETKLLQKKKEVRDLEQTFLKQINALEKEKTILSEKLSNFEEKKKESQENYEKEIENLQNNLKNSRKDISKEKADFLSNLDTMKKKVISLEADLAEKTGTFEKDQILWEGKFKFIEQQRDNYKKDLNESQKRFENLLDSMQKKGNLEKEKLESAQNNTISNLEQKYMNQIKELQENNQKTQSELINQNKELERENKNLIMQVELKGKNNDNSALLVQIEELQNERNKFKKDFEEIKKDRDKQIIELMGNSEKEKMGLKVKISEAENKVREIEAKRGSIMLDYEKDKAKWSIEKDNLSSKIVEIQENFERLEKKNENLMRENEKLKSDKQNNRRSSKGGLQQLSGLLGQKDSYNLNVGQRAIGSLIGNTYMNMNNNNSNTANNNLSTNPYSKEIKDINKILDHSDIDGDGNNLSKIMGEKSFEKMDIGKPEKIDPRYENNNNTERKSDYFEKKNNLMSFMNMNRINVQTPDAKNNALDNNNNSSNNLTNFDKLFNKKK